MAIVADVLDKRRWTRLALETKLVLAMTGVLIVGGAAALLAFEWQNPATLGSLPPAQRGLNALFESVSFRTAGISTVPMDRLTDPSLLTAIVLMFIGGASGRQPAGSR